MNGPRKFGARPLLLGTVTAFAISVIIASATLIFERVQNIDQRRQLIFWSAAQTNLEYRRFIHAFDLYALGSKDVGKDTVMLRLDILWSRIGIYDAGPVADRLNQVEGVHDTVRSLADTLRVVEPMIRDLVPGDMERYRNIRKRIVAHGFPLNAAVQRINRVEQASYVDFRGRTLRAQVLLIVLMFGVLVSGALLVALLLREAGKSKRLLNEAVDARRTAQRNARHVQEIVETVRDAIVTADSTGKIVSFNSSAEKMFGRPYRQVLGENLDILLDDESRGVCRRYRANFDAGRAAPTLEIAGRRADGVPFPLELSLGEMRGDQGRMFVAVFRDLTERKRAETEVLHAQKIDALGKLTGEVAHEFNNLLMAIEGYGRLALEQRDKPDRVKEYVGEVLKASEIATHLTDQMLSFGRKQQLRPKLISVSQVLGGLKSLLQPVIRSNIDLDMRIPDEDIWVFVDSMQLSQAILNMAINASHAMPAGGSLTIASARVTGRRRRAAMDGVMTSTDRFVAISVTDTGSGMDKETVAHIFEPFYSTKPEGGGTGLGLSMVHGMVEQSGGWIDVRSELGHGSTFTINLPEAIPDELGPLETSPDAPCDAAASPEGTPAILVAEDQVQVRELARIALEEKGYRVLAAENGAEAISLYRACGAKVGLLLADVWMPGMTGQDLADALIGENPDLQVILMSGKGARADLDKYAWGARAGYIRKPFDPSELTRLVDERMAAGAGS